MQVQISENKLIELYFAIDELYKSFIAFQQSKGIASLKRPKRTTQISASEICTILVSYHLSGYKCFEYYYRNIIRIGYKDYFPNAPEYTTFLGYIPKTFELMSLWLLYTSMTADRTGLYILIRKNL